MTLHAATVNLGLRTTGYQPVVVLVDEAGQIPLAHASVIGTFGCGSVIFIGDHEQMPPIYSDSLENDPLSVSIFEHLVRHYPEKTITLNTTYRMNEKITALCSRNFYEPHGVILSVVTIPKTVSFTFHYWKKKDGKVPLPILPTPLITITAWR